MNGRRVVRRWACGVSVMVAMTTMTAAGCATSRSVDAPCVDSEAISAESCRVERLGEERLGALALGTPMGEVLAALGPASEVGEPFEEGATGEVVRTYTWAKAGIRIDSARGSGEPSADPAGSAPTTLEYARSVEVRAPFAGKTRRRIGIGSTEAEVERAYADTIDRETSARGEKVVAGSVFGGMIFEIEGGRVASIFLGAAAE